MKSKVRNEKCIRIKMNIKKFGNVLHLYTVEDQDQS